MKTKTGLWIDHRKASILQIAAKIRQHFAQ